MSVKGEFGEKVRFRVECDNWLGKVVLKDGIAIKESSWIKADVTFEGLKQITFEPAGRVFIGDEPEIESRVRNNKRRYISAVNISSLAGYDGRHGSWFKNEKIDLSKELVAIIGNKGNGKSALTDVIGLLGNSHNQKYEKDGKKEELFSFLNKDKFLKGNCASNFNAELHWYAGSPDKELLDKDTDTSVPEHVEYLPQKYLEKICANIEDDEFRHKLNEVIFEYVKESERYGQTTLDDLIDYLTTQTAEDIGIAKAELHDKNTKLVSLEKRATPDYKKDLEEKLRLKQADLTAHIEARPKEVPPPVQGGAEAARSAAEIRTIDEKISALQKEIREFQIESAALARAEQDLIQARQTIDRHAAGVNALKEKYEKLLNGEGLRFEEIITVKTSYEKIDAIIKTKRSRVLELAEALRSTSEIISLGLNSEQESVAKEKSLLCQRSVLEKTKKEITDGLDKPNREYQMYLTALGKWQARQRLLEGEPANPAFETVSWLKQELEFLSARLPGELKAAKDERTKASTEVLSKKKALSNFMNE